MSTWAVLKGFPPSSSRLAAGECRSNKLHVKRVVEKFVLLVRHVKLEVLHQLLGYQPHANAMG